MDIEIITRNIFDNICSQFYFFLLFDWKPKAKIAGLIQKPQQFGLLKRGLGGLSNEELLESKMSFKKEPTVGQPKATKITAMSLTAADVQQRIGKSISDFVV